MTAAASLPDDIGKEILSKLPVMSVVRFKLVSKSWYSLISNRQFIKLHLRQSVESSNHPLFVVIEGLSSKYFIKSSSNIFESTGSDIWYRHHRYLNKYRYRILCSCDGLLMIRKNHPWKNSLVAIWNPAIGESRELPLLQGDRCLCIPYGLGYDSSTDDYKVVCGAYNKAGDKITLMVFSLKSNSWRKNQVFNCKLSTPSNSGTHMNGVLYWLNYRQGRNYLVGFKLAEEKMLELPLPDDINVYEEKDDEDVLTVLGELKGRLCLSHSIWEAYSKGIHTLVVWLLKEDCDEAEAAASAASWTKFITLPQMHLGWRHLSGVERFFCFSKLIVFVMMDDEGENSLVLVFDLEKQQLVETRWMEGIDFGMLTFVHSLVSPK